MASILERNALAVVAGAMCDVNDEVKAAVAHKLKNIASVLETGSALPGEGAVSSTPAYYLECQMAETVDLLFVS